MHNHRSLLFSLGNKHCLSLLSIFLIQCEIAMLARSALRADPFFHCKLAELVWSYLFYMFILIKHLWFPFSKNYRLKFFKIKNRRIQFTLEQAYVFVSITALFWIYSLISQIKIFWKKFICKFEKVITLKWRHCLQIVQAIHSKTSFRQCFRFDTQHFF